MLTELKLTNFRIFDDEVTVRFRPITILIGRNSSGKSSVIKFLQMLQQSTGLRTSEFLSPSGELVNLGGFEQLKNRLTAKDSLSFEASMQFPVGDEAFSLPKTILELQGVSNDDLIFKMNATLPYNDGACSGGGGYSLVRASLNQAILDVAFGVNGDSMFLDVSSDPATASAIKESIELMAILGKLGETTEGIRLPDPPDPEMMMEYLHLANQSIANQQLIRSLRHQVFSLIHLAPVRHQPGRVVQAFSPPPGHVGQTGEHTLPHLRQMMSEGRDSYDFMLPFLRSVADIDRIRFDDSSAFVSHTYARNKTTGADVSIADYGFGVGQSLPVLVQGAIMEPYTTLMVEQPEAQLHPTAQLEMGGFFADLWNKRKVGSIIETHSDNILLRLRRLIAKGDLSNKDVSIAYFTFDEERESMPIVKNLDINEDGSLQPGLPMMFFGADIEEGFLLGARE